MQVAGSPETSVPSTQFTRGESQKTISRWITQVLPKRRYHPPNSREVTSQNSIARWRTKGLPKRRYHLPNSQGVNLRRPYQDG
jgi:hypothetical protein